MSEAEHVSQLVAKTPLREINTNVAPRRGFACVLPMGQCLPVTTQPVLHTRQELLQEDSHSVSTSTNSSSGSSSVCEESTDNDNEQEQPSTTPCSRRSSSTNSSTVTDAAANDVDQVVLSPVQLHGAGPVTPERPTNAEEVFFRTARSLTIPPALAPPKTSNEAKPQPETPAEAEAAPEAKKEQVEAAPLVQKTPSKPIEVSIRRPQQLLIATTAAPVQMEVLFEEHCSERFFTSSESSPISSSVSLLAKDPSPLAMRKPPMATIPPLNVESIAAPKSNTTPAAGLVLLTASSKRTLSPLLNDSKGSGDRTPVHVLYEKSSTPRITTDSAETQKEEPNAEIATDEGDGKKEKKKKPSFKERLMKPVYPFTKLSVPPPAPRLPSQTPSPRGVEATAAATTTTAATATTATTNINQNDNVALMEAERIKLERYARELSPSDCRRAMMCEEAVQGAAQTPIKCDTNVPQTPSPEPHKYTRAVSNDTVARGTSSSNGCSTGRTPERSEGFSSMEKDDETADVQNIYIVDHPLPQAEESSSLVRALSERLLQQSVKLQEQLLIEHACGLIEFAEQTHTQWNDLLLTYHVAMRSPISAEQIELSNSSLHTLPVSKAEKATNSPRSYFPERISCKFEHAKKALPVPTAMTLLFQLYEAAATPAAGDLLLQTYYRRKEELHELAVKHALFDTMYLYMVAIPAFRMIEIHSRRLICMRRDLYVRSRIELFMVTSPTNQRVPRKELLLGPLRVAASAVAGKPIPNSTQRILASMGIKMERKSSAGGKQPSSEAAAKGLVSTASAVPLQAEELVSPAEAAQKVEPDTQPRPYVCLPGPCHTANSSEDVPEPPPLAAIIAEQTRAHQLEQQAGEEHGPDGLVQQGSGPFPSPSVTSPLSSDETQVPRHTTPLQRFFEGVSFSRQSSKRASLNGTPNYPPHLSLNAKSTKGEAEAADEDTAAASTQSATKRSHDSSLFVYLAKKKDHKKQSEKEKERQLSTPNKRKKTSYYERFKRIKFRMEDDRKHRMQKEPTTTPEKEKKGRKRHEKEEEDEQARIEKRLTEGRVAIMHEEDYRVASRSMSMSHRPSVSTTTASVSAENVANGSNGDDNHNTNTHGNNDDNTNNNNNNNINNDNESNDDTKQKNDAEKDDETPKNFKLRLLKHKFKFDWRLPKTKDENGMALPTIKTTRAKPPADHRCYTRVVRNKKGVQIGLRAKEKKAPKQRKRSPKPSPTESMLLDLEECED